MKHTSEKLAEASALHSEFRASERACSPSLNFWRASYFPALDGLRALSLLLVVGGHTRTDLPARSWLSGGLGVSIFFVLSGFLITTLLLRESQVTGTVSLGAFYIRRAFRILPPYFVTIVVYLAVGLFPSQQDLRRKFLRGLPYYLSLRNEYVPQGMQVAFTHSWSLSVEEKFYFFWPVVLLFLLRSLRAKWALVPITLAPLVVSPVRSLPLAYFALMLGCCVATGIEALRSRQEQVRLWLDRIPVTAVALLWIGTYFASLRGNWRLGFIMSTALLLPFLLLKRTALSQALGSEFCVWIGKRTYSMYLFHAFCLTLIESRLLPPSTNLRYLGTVVLAYAFSLLVAAFMYRAIESPCIAWGRSLASDWARAHREKFQPCQREIPLGH